MEENKNNNEQQGNDSGKIAATYDKNIKKLVAILQGDQPLKSAVKVPSDEVGKLVKELLKEKQETAAKAIKTSISELIEKKVQMDKDFKKAEADLKKLKEQKQKEFNEAAGKVFTQIDGLDQMEKDYYATLGGNNDNGIGLTQTGSQA